MSLEENRKFEERLRSIRPAQVDPRVKSRIEAGIDKRERDRRLARFRAGIGWAGMAVAASLLITFGFLLFNGRLSISPAFRESPESMAVDPNSAQSDTPEEDNAFKPVLAENNLTNRIDEGIVFLRNGLTARRYRYEFIDRVVWENPANGAIVEMEIPRDEVILVPVQTF